MRSTVLTLLGAAALSVRGGAALVAQQTPPPVQLGLPVDIRREVADRWNAANAVRASGRLEIPIARDVPGNVAVTQGPLVLAGHVQGSVTAINADVMLGRAAQIDGDLLVVGGTVTGRDVATVIGRIRIYRDSLAFRQEGDRMIVLGDSTETIALSENWWDRFQEQREGNWHKALRVVQAGPYNRVEGLPIDLGPAVNQLTPWGSVGLEAAAVFRTGSSFSSTGGDIGHQVRGEVRFGVGDNRAIGLGGQMLNVVDGVESWQLSDLETALAAFVARRDYRDYYQRHGGNAFITLYGTGNVSLRGSYGEERWSSAVLRNPFTLFNDDRPWRPSPAMDEGLFRIATLTLRFDTRTDPEDPWSGWWANANIEHGNGNVDALAPSSDLSATAGPRQYTRGLFDVRRYNRLGPYAQFNVRLLAGGWLGGDELPLERRMSVDGPGALPGFDFRSPRAGPDVGTCDAGISIPGRPAQCDRIALAQLEFKGDLPLDVLGWLPDVPHHYHSEHGDAMWVLFADAGRGWDVGPGAVGSPIGFASSTIPPFPTFRTDVGFGLDFGRIGFYAAKSTSKPSEPMNFFLRLGHRF